MRAGYAMDGLGLTGLECHERWPLEEKVAQSRIVSLEIGMGR
jgi:hypothetical protein